MMKIFNTTLKASLMAAVMLGAGAPVMAQVRPAPAPAPQEPGEHRMRDHEMGDHKMDRFKNMTIAERVEKRLQQMDKQLDLSDAQVAALRPILTEDMQKLQNAREAMKAARTADKVQDKAAREAAREAARAEMKAQMQTTKDRIAAVLTPEQREKAKAHMKEMRAHVRENIEARHEKLEGTDGAQRQELKKELREQRKAERKLDKKLEKKNAK